MIMIESLLYDSIHDYLTQMTENLGADWDCLGTLEEAVEDEVIKPYIKALESEKVENLTTAVFEAYREVIIPVLRPMLHVIRKRTSGGTLRTEMLEIYATILADDFTRIINEYAV